jgi:uncharacterized protein YqeY
VTIQQELADELKDAMKTRDSQRRDVIRQVQTEVAQARSEPGFDGEVDDVLYRKVITSYVKKMEKARNEYLEYGERGEAMAGKLGYEIEYLGRWLPRKLDEEQTIALVKASIAELGVGADPKAAGRVIGALMKQRGADLDGGLVGRIVARELGGG